MNKVALFDFCETIANFQTADAYVDFVRNKVQTNRMLLLERIFSFCERFRFLDYLDILTKRRFSISKRFKLYQLKNLDISMLEGLAYQYYTEMIKPNFIKSVIKEIEEKKRSGYNIYIVSGGYDIYLKHFASEFCVDAIFSTKIEFKDNICTGKFDGVDCMDQNKVICLNKFFIREEVESIAYSDSITDLPMLLWANHQYVISKNTSQAWAKSNNLKEIIWDSSKN